MALEPGRPRRGADEARQRGHPRAALRPPPPRPGGKPQPRRHVPAERPSSWQKGREVRFTLIYHEESCRSTPRISWREDDAAGLAFLAAGEEPRPQRPAPPPPPARLAAALLGLPACLRGAVGWKSGAVGGRSGAVGCKEAVSFAVRLLPSRYLGLNVTGLCFRSRVSCFFSYPSLMFRPGPPRGRGLGAREVLGNGALAGPAEALEEKSVIDGERPGLGATSLGVLDLVDPLIVPKIEMPALLARAFRASPKLWSLVEVIDGDLVLLDGHPGVARFFGEPAAAAFLLVSEMGLGRELRELWIDCCLESWRLLETTSLRAFDPSTEPPRRLEITATPLLEDRERTCCLCFFDEVAPAAGRRAGRRHRGALPPGGRHPAGPDLDRRPRRRARLLQPALARAGRPLARTFAGRRLARAGARATTAPWSRSCGRTPTAATKASTPNTACAATPGSTASCSTAAPALPLRRPLPRLRRLLHRHHRAAPRRGAAAALRTGTTAS